MTRRPAADPRIAVAYLRVSTDEQALGPEAQRAAIDAWAKTTGVRVAAVYEDRGVSGATELEDRPSLLSALQHVAELRAGVLVVARRDRLARDVVVAAMVERAAARHGARVVSADGAGNGDSPADAFMKTVIDGAAAYERALIRARTKAALAAKKARGERVGTLPYGYRLAEDGQRVVRDESEQGVLARVRELRREGMSLRQIGRELERLGILSRTGRPFVLARLSAMAREVA